jgi:hypothetical protein
MQDKISKTSGDLSQEARETSENLAEAARKTAADAGRGLREEAAMRADSAKAGVAGEVSDVASALRKAAGDMRDGSAQERTFGQIASSLADVSDTIRDKDLGQVASEVSDFAKRNPLLFLGGVALAGFAATRFAMASSRSADDSTQDYASTRPDMHRNTRGDLS